MQQKQPETAELRRAFLSTSAAFLAIEQRHAEKPAPNTPSPEKTTTSEKRTTTN